MRSAPVSFLGAPKVIFDGADEAALFAPFCFALVRKFSHSRPPVNQLRRTFGGCGLAGPVEVGVLDGLHILIRPSLEADFLRLRTKPLWFIAKAPMWLFCWPSAFSPSRESAIAPVWVSMPDLPLHLFAKASMFHLARSFGSPLLLDKPTLSRSHPSPARMLVEVDESLPLPTQVQLSLTGDELLASSRI